MKSVAREQEQFLWCPVAACVVFAAMGIAVILYRAEQRQASGETRIEGIGQADQRRALGKHVGAAHRDALRDGDLGDLGEVGLLPFQEVHVPEDL